MRGQPFAFAPHSGYQRIAAGRTILVMDCGTESSRHPEDLGEKLIAPYLQSCGVDNIDIAVLSHPHSDHVSGYAGLWLRADEADKKVAAFNNMSQDGISGTRDWTRVEAVTRVPEEAGLVTLR